jgi:hypothetical protein
MREDLLKAKQKWQDLGVLFRILENNQDDMPKSGKIAFSDLNFISDEKATDLTILCPRNEAHKWEAFFLKLFPTLKFKNHKFRMSDKKYYSYQAEISPLGICIQLGFWEIPQRENNVYF